MSSLGFSFISNNESDNIEQTPKKKHCRTLRKKHKKKSKIDSLLNSLSINNNIKEGFDHGDRQNISSRERGDCDEDDDNCLADFHGPLSENQNIPKESYTSQSQVPIVGAYSGTNDDNEKDDDTVVENFAQLDDVSAQDYYKQYVPYYSQMQGTSSDVYTNKDELMQKLNYMIHLMEEQQDEKTSNVTEELVLYLFLGVFVIFIVDSFARVGKYQR